MKKQSYLKNHSLMVQSVGPDSEAILYQDSNNVSAMKSKAFSVNEEIFDNTLETVENTNRSMVQTKNIEDLDQEKSWKTKIENWSIFGIRFGVYIDNSTRFVSKCA